MLIKVGDQVKLGADHHGTMATILTISAPSPTGQMGRVGEVKTLTRALDSMFHVRLSCGSDILVSGKQIVF